MENKEIALHLVEIYSKGLNNRGGKLNEDGTFNVYKKYYTELLKLFREENESNDEEEKILTAADFIKWRNY